MQQEEIANYDKLPNGITYPTKQEIDDYKLPVYTTKHRIKSRDSIYLKGIIDKETDINKIDDIVGFRIICLFEKDIDRLHRYLAKALNEDGFKLIDFKIFNWRDKDY